MGKHKFFVGQTVLVVSSQFADIQEGERFRIVRLLPLEGVAPQYRIAVSWTDTNGLLVRPNSPR